MQFHYRPIVVIKIDYFLLKGFEDCLVLDEMIEKHDNIGK